VGRLEDIVERNQHPRRHRKMKVPYGLMVSLLVLVVLVLVIFTDLGMPKQEPKPPPDHSRVNGVQLRRATPADARSD
jgi:hypothetical protein